MLAQGLDPGLDEAFLIRDDKAEDCLQTHSLHPLEFFSLFRRKECVEGNARILKNRSDHGAVDFDQRLRVDACTFQIPDDPRPCPI